MTNELLNLTDIGKRLKQEAKLRGLKNDDMATLLGYSDGHQISPIYSGKQALQESQYDILHRAWKIRKEYLQCLDNWPTEADMLNALNIENKKALEITLRYFELLGYNIKFNMYTNLYPVTLYKLHRKGLLRGYISDTTYQEIINTFDFSLSSPLEFQQKHSQYMNVKFKIELRKAFDKCIIDFEDMGLYTDAPSKIINSLHTGESVAKINIDYFVSVLIMKNNKEIKQTSIKDFLDIAQALNNMSTCFIDNAINLHKNTLQ